MNEHVTPELKAIMSPRLRLRDRRFRVRDGQDLLRVIEKLIYYSSSSAIGQRKYRIPSDLRSQALYRPVSTMVGDHMGILGAEVLLACRPEFDILQFKIFYEGCLGPRVFEGNQAEHGADIIAGGSV